jgi:hypothetical protein
MPVLPNPRYEAFCQARARGARLDDAYEDAGFVLHKGHSSRLARRPEVAERIAEIRAKRDDAEDVSPQRALATLLRMAKAAEASENAALVKEGRLALLDAARLQQLAEQGRRQDHVYIFDESGSQERAAARAPGP